MDAPPAQDRDGDGIIDVGNIDVPASSQVHHQVVRKACEAHDIDIAPAVPGDPIGYASYTWRVSEDAVDVTVGGVAAAWTGPGTNPLTTEVFKYDSVQDVSIRDDHGPRVTEVLTTDGNPIFEGGVTSPINSSKGTMMRILIQPTSCSPNRVSRMAAILAEEAMLTNSLPQIIEMISRRGSSSMAWMLSECLSLLCRSFWRSIRLREKRAVSEPEKTAEDPSRIT